MRSFFKGYKNILLHGRFPDQMIAWLIIVVLIITAGVCTFKALTNEIREIPASQFIVELDANNIAKMDICSVDGSAEGEFREEVDGFKKFVTSLPEKSDVLTQVYLDNLNKSRAVDGGEDYVPLEYTFAKQSQLTGALLTVVTFIIEFGLIILLFSWILKRNGGGGLLPMGGGSAIVKAEIPNTTFEDVAGVPEAIEEVSEIVTFLKDPDIYNRVGAKFPKGVLMHGNPGSGKTLLARALAGEAGVPFIHASGSDFVEMYVGVGAKRVRELFAKAKKVAPSILFIDEIDAVGTDRDGANFANSEHLQTINALLSEMDGFDNTDAVIVIGATNRLEALDKALIRPGRFDRLVTVDMPAKDGRIEILQHYAQDKLFAEEIDFNKLATHTYGFSGAQLESVMNQAATLAARRAYENDTEPQITMEDLDEGISRVISGPAMKSKQMSLKEKRETAYHEAGHAVVQYLLPDCDDVQKISIVSRNMPGVGTALGYVQSYSEEDEYVTTAAKCRAEIAALLAGRCSEKHFCGIESAGASNDLERASKLAYNMVDKFAFDHKWEDVNYHSFRVEVKDNKTSLNKASNERLKEIDTVVDSILDAGYNEAERIISKNEDKIEVIVDTLMKEETIDGDEIKKIMEGEKDNED